MKTKHLVILLIFSIALTCCKSAKELAMEGKYDKAFNKVLGDLKKQPSDAESLKILKLSFDNANNQNLNQINQLNLKNSPERWETIVQLYQSLQGRQDKINQLLPFLPATAQSTFRTTDYSRQLTSAQQNAANYNYSKGLSLLDSGNKMNIRNSITYFKKVKNYNPNYPEINQLIDEANFRGINHTLFLVNNYTSQNLPINFITRIEQIGNNSYLNSEWVRYYTTPTQNFNYDYVVELNLNYIRQIPERISSKSSTYTKTIDDGWEYEYDRRGNVKKDDKGNDIKRKKTKTVRCEVIQYTQTKAITLESNLNYIYAQTNRAIRSIPISVEEAFFYEYVIYKGDKSAVDRQILAKLPKNERPAPFPSTIDMLFMTQDRFSNLVYTALKNNNNIIRN